MQRRRASENFLPTGGDGFHIQTRKSVPHEFVLEAMAPLLPRTRAMFGCVAVYVEDKIVFCLRDKAGATPDNGVWLATTKEHHESLRREFPSMRSIQALGKDVTNWQIIPAESMDFEDAALRVCELIIARDPRIGKVPASRRATRRPRGKAAKSTKRAKASKRAGKR